MYFLTLVYLYIADTDLKKFMKGIFILNNYHYSFNFLSYKLLLAALFLTGFGMCYAQKISLDTFQKKYAGESKIYLNYKRDLNIKIVGDSLNISMRNYEESLCLDKNAYLFSNEDVTYSELYKLKKLFAETLLPGRFGYKSIKVKRFDTSDYRNPMVFYDDIKSIKFSFPKLKEGARTLLDYTYSIREPRNIGGFYFNNSMPVENAELTVTCPASVKLGYKLYNCDSLKVEFTQQLIKNTIVYKWKAKNIPRINIEENSPSFAYFAGHIFVYINNYTVNGICKKVLSDANDLHRWYSGLIAPLNQSDSPALKSFVDSLTQNATTEIEKVRKIFFWVEDHIKYIAFEAGNGGYVPRNADQVFSKRYGDCKDMASIINKMLSLAGIESHLTWIGTRHIPYNYEDLPLPASDNHMIDTYKVDGKYIFLDATTGPHPFNYPSYMIQGKEAMIDLGNGKFEIVKVPVIAPELNLHTDTLKIKLEGKKVVGSGVSYFRGYPRFDMYNYLAYKDKTEQNVFLKGYFEKGNNKFLIDRYVIKNFEQRDKDLIISYDFNVSDYSQVIGDEIFINMNMQKINVGDPLKNTRKTDVEANYKKKIVNEVIMDIPRGYVLSYLPENSEYKNDMFGYKLSYQSKNNKVQLTHELYTNYLLLPPQKMKDWNSMLESLKNAYKSTIILKKDR